MKKLLTVILTVGMAAIAVGQVTVEVRQPDGVTPFDGGDVMVGTRLAIVVSSDANDYWSGGLFIEGEDRNLGTLAGRDFDPNRLLYDPNLSFNGIVQYVRDWAGSHYESAGELAKVTAWQDSSIWGFDLYTTDVNDSNFVAGDWFVIDYYADKVGDCNVGFYDYGTSWDEPEYYISFFNVPTRDINPDEKVDFGDYAIFASRWNAVDCNEPDWCEGADIDRDGDVDTDDVGLFVEYWLWGASDGDPNWPNDPNGPNDPNDPNDPIEGCQGDPNVTYSIVDINDSNEITTGVNESITLYVRMVTTKENNVSIFDIEVNISDTNLGFIDNTPIGSIDPLPTAQILAEPDRLEWADYWGPGVKQEEGIELFGATWDSPLSDGYLASFVFTCKGEGDVTLELINWLSYNTDSEEVCPKLENILIHQNGPN